MQARHYQKIAAKEVLEKFTLYNSVMLQMPTGGGKTMVFTHLIAKPLVDQGNIIWIVAHRQELIGGSMATAQKAGLHCGVVRADLPRAPYAPVQVVSIDTIMNRDDVIPPNYIIIDECHRVQLDNTYGALIDRFPSAKVLGVTATPYRLSGKGFNDVFESLITTLQTGDLIKQGFLCPIFYPVIANAPTDVERLSTGEYDPTSFIEKSKMVPIVESYQDHAGGKRALVFASSVKHAYMLQSDFENSAIRSEVIHGDMKDAERVEFIRGFTDGDLHVLINVGIAIEGTDIPATECVILAMRTASLSRFLQMVGRGLRPVNGHELSQLETDNERRQAIAKSPKPYCIILDCGGNYLDHGFPDQNHDWELHFQGLAKKHRKDLPTIEFDEYLLEDEEGVERIERVKPGGAIPEELEGYRLISVTPVYQEIAQSKGAYHRFIQEVERHKRIRKSRSYETQLKYYPALFAFKDFCNSETKQLKLIPDACFEQIYTEFVDPQYITKKIKEIEAGIIRKAEMLKEGYKNDPIRYEPQIKQMTQNEKQAIERLKKNKQDNRFYYISKKAFNEHKKAHHERIERKNKAAKGSL